MYLNICSVWPTDIVQTQNGPSAQTALDSQNGPSVHSSFVQNGPLVYSSCVQNGPSVHLACVLASLSWGPFWLWTISDGQTLSRRTYRRTDRREVIYSSFDSLTLYLQILSFFEARPLKPYNSCMQSKQIYVGYQTNLSNCCWQGLIKHQPTTCQCNWTKCATNNFTRPTKGYLMSLFILIIFKMMTFLLKFISVL